MQENLTFGQALDLDLAARGMKDADLGKAIGVTQQSVNKWRKRGFPPPYRLGDMQRVLGADSHLAKLDMGKILDSTPRLRREAPRGSTAGAAAVGAATLVGGVPVAAPVMAGAVAAGAVAAGGLVAAILGGASRSQARQMPSTFHASLYSDKPDGGNWETPAQAWRAMQEVDFFKALPPRLRSCVEPPADVTGKLTPDVLTSTHACNLVFDSPGSHDLPPMLAAQWVEHAALHLVALRARHLPNVAPVVGWVRSRDGGGEVVTEWARALGVHIAVADSGAALAELLSNTM